MGKDVFKRYLLVIKSRKFEPLRRYRNEASMPRLYYIPVHVSLLKVHSISYIIHDGVGWLSCLS